MLQRFTPHSYALRVFRIAYRENQTDRLEPIITDKKMYEEDTNLRKEGDGE